MADKINITKKSTIQYAETAQWLIDNGFLPATSGGESNANIGIITGGYPFEIS